MIISFNDLYLALPTKFQTEEIKAALKMKYDYLVEWMLKEGKRAVNPVYVLSTWRYAGDQIICEGEVRDKNLPFSNTYNWHLQNTSQWVFAFGLLFDTRDKTFSIHT